MEGESKTYERKEKSRDRITEMNKKMRIDRGRKGGKTDIRKEDNK